MNVSFGTGRGGNLELEYKRVGEVENLTASGTPKEMAALVLELQERRTVKLTVKQGLSEERKKLADTIRDVLVGQVQENNSRQPPCPTEHTPNQDEESHPDEPDRKSDTPQQP